MTSVRRTVSSGRPLQIAGLALVMLFVLLPTVSAQNAGAPGQAKISDEVLGHLRSVSATDLVPLIVETRGAPSDAHLARMSGLGGALKARFTAINGYAARVPAAAIDSLAADPDVEHISFDTPVHSHMDVAYRAVKADAAFADFQLSGAGVGVAVIDTGVAFHQDLVRNGNTTNVTEIEIVGHEGGLADYFGHGTHVAGIIAGNGASSSGAGSFRTFQGIAPGVNLYSVRALYPDGTGYTSDIIAGINWAIASRASLNIRVLNLSLGHPVYESYTTDPLCRAVRAAFNAGLAVVVAAGNDGQVGTGFGTITSPGNEPSAITVGAMDDQRTVTTTDDTLAPYSSKGPTLVDHVVKPDLVAPGTRIVSLRDPNSYLDTTYHQFTLRIGDYSYDTLNAGLDGAYYSLSGTSMAAPMVTAAAALMLRKDPTLNPATVKARLMASAVKDTALMFETGAGELDVDAALKATGYATSAMSPLSVLVSDKNVYLQDTSLIWGGGWDLATVYGSQKGAASGVKMTRATGTIATSLSLIWGGGVWDLCGSSSLIWNNSVTSSGLIWGLDACSLIWGGNDNLSAEGAIWSHHH